MAWGAILHSIAKVVLATLPVGLIGWLVSRMTLWSLSGVWLEKGIWLMGGIGACIAVYFLMHRWFKSDELGFVLNMIKERRR